MLLNVMFQIILRVNRILANQAIDAHGVVRLTDQVIISDDDHDGPIVFEDGRPNWAGTHSLEVGLRGPKPRNTGRHENRRTQQRRGAAEPGTSSCARSLAGRNSRGADTDLQSIF